MNNKFTIDQLAKSETIDPNSINKLYKLNLMCEFMEIKSNNPRLTQKEICSQLGFSDSTIKRYRDDIHMDSPYNRSKYKKRATEQKPTTITEDRSKNENKINEKRIKNRLKNEIKGGNISDINTISGKELIEQAFETTLND